MEITRPGSDREYRSQQVQQSQPENTRRRRSSPSLVILLCLILIAIAAAGGYLWRDRDAKTNSQTQQARITELEQKVTDLQKQQAAANSTPTNTSPTPKAPSQATLDNIKDSVKSGNYAALEGFMAPSVSVIIAASDGVGNRTPAQAVNDVKYLDSGTDPWDFALPASTIASYQEGDYAKYFPDTALVGKSANDHVVSFTFNSDGKINGIFMSVDDGLL